MSSANLEYSTINQVAKPQLVRVQPHPPTYLPEGSNVWRPCESRSNLTYNQDGLGPRILNEQFDSTQLTGSTPVSAGAILYPSLYTSIAQRQSVRLIRGRSMVRIHFEVPRCFVYFYPPIQGKENSPYRREVACGGAFYRLEMSAWSSDSIVSFQN